MRSILLTVLLFISGCCLAQEEVSILTYAVSAEGTPRLEVANETDFYYVLFAEGRARTLVQGDGQRAVLTEPLAALPEAAYTVRRYPRATPADLDKDGVDDLTELIDFPTRSPLNAARPIAFADGVACIHDKPTFDELAFQPGESTENERLRSLEFVKFYIQDNDEPDSMRVHYMHTENHEAHVEFARAIGIPTQANGNSFLEDMRGLLIYHPEVTAPSGEQGVYTFEFQQFDDYTYDIIQQTFDLLGATLPFLRNNLAYLPLHRRAVARYNVERDLYDASRIPVLLEGDLYEGIDYIPLNLTEGYGRLRLMEIGERPDPRDIVVFETIPNDLPRVGGIITTVVQTPLSHVNLRAIQNDVPNAFIRNALDMEAVNDLLDHIVYYRVDADTFALRLATPAEVDAHYEALRPDEDQFPPRDLSVQQITPLDDITFDQSIAFGAKTSNLATMRSFAFPDYLIPDGFGIPFYFYDEFMVFNGFYERVETMLAATDFQTDFSVQEQMLEELRDDIEDAELPPWMFEALTLAQEAFPEGTNIRCRSSTNNEDLPGFSGAGLYDSKTHNTDEGHLGKTIKEVFASLWNFRAFTEREFYRIDHLQAAMGVLMHPNFKEERANGVGITADPIYGSGGNYYLNTQVGEDLVTNPDNFSIPEEILLAIEGSGPTAYEIIRRSNLVPNNDQVMPLPYLDELRGYMRTIHEEFALLYDAVDVESFSMDIEYKIDSTDRLAIKQARPWIGFLDQQTSTEQIAPSQLQLSIYPNPMVQDAVISFELPQNAEVESWLFDLTGRPVKRIQHGNLPAGMQQIRLTVGDLPPAAYVLRLRLEHGSGKIDFTTVRVVVQ